MTFLNRQLYIVRVMIEAANDDQILQSTGDEELAFIDEAKIPGAQEWSIAATGKVRAKCLFRQLGFAPVALSHARSCDPDLAHLARRTFRRDVRMNDDDLLRAEISTAANQ